MSGIHHGRQSPPALREHDEIVRRMSYLSIVIGRGCLAVCLLAAGVEGDGNSGMLSLLVKGEKAISYQQAIEILIPQAVAHWTVMCIFLTRRYGVSLWGKKPVPKWPHAGFLLAHRQGALDCDHH